MELARQNFSADRTVLSNTVQDVGAFNSQSLASRIKKRDKLISILSALTLEKFSIYWVMI